MKVSRDVFERLVDKALEELPPAFAKHFGNVMVEVRYLPDERTVHSMGIRDRRGLLGLYHGIPLTDRHVEAPPGMPDRITLYQANIERICRTKDELIQQIRHTVLHEIGHHFGLDEDDLDEVGYG